MKPEAFLTLADQLAKANDAASRRSATSRAYYAVFHTAVDRLTTSGLRYKAVNASHKKLQDLLTNSGDSDLTLIGEEMADLLASRKAADYDLRKAEPEQNATALTNVATARDLIQRLATAFGGPNAPAAVDAMRAYAKLAGIPV